MKRKIAFIGFSFLSGLMAASFGWGKYNIYIILASFVLAIMMFFFLQKFRVYVTAIAVSFLVGVVYITAYTHFSYDRIIRYDNQSVTFAGKVEEYEYLHSDFGRLTLRGKINNDVSTRITFFVPDDSYDYYDLVEVKSKVMRIDDNINFSAEEYNRPKGEYLKGNGDVQTRIIKKNTNPIMNAVKNYRDHILSVMDHYVNGDESAFLKAILCGDKTQLSTHTKTNLYRVGIGHIMAVSGMHISIIAILFNLLLGMVIKNRKIKFVLLQFLMWSFAVFAGLSPSVIRAVIMLTAVQISDIILKVSDPMNTLGCCILIMTALNPYVVRDPSFVLSLTGAISMGVIVPAVVGKVKQTGLKGKIIKSCVVVLVPMFTATPVLILFFDEISLAAPISNLLLTPMCTLALAITAVVLVTGGVSFIALPVLKISESIIHIVIICAAKIASLNYSYVEISTLKTKLILGVLCFLWILFVLNIKNIKYFAGSVITIYALIIAVYNFMKIPDVGTYHIVFIPDDGVSQVLIYKNYSSVVADLGVKGKTNPALRNLMDKRGIKSTQSVLIMEHSYYTGYQYLELFYPKQVELYGDFSEQTDIYKNQTAIPFENIVFYSTDNGYETQINTNALKMHKDMFYLNNKKYDLKNEKFPIEIEISENNSEVWRLDYGFDKQYRLG
ncbi:MAG: ComEC/Rec2 family competence protein [Ruminococcus sp.]|nr:ComEC/Rec2 family competence protein [Ruminococcus sp.]